MENIIEVHQDIEKIQRNQDRKPGREKQKKKDYTYDVIQSNNN